MLLSNLDLACFQQRDSFIWLCGFLHSGLQTTIASVLCYGSCSFGCCWGDGSCLDGGHHSGGKGSYIMAAGSSIGIATTIGLHQSLKFGVHTNFG